MTIAQLSLIISIGILLANMAKLILKIKDRVKNKKLEKKA